MSEIAQKKIMLVDESAFIWIPLTVDAKIRNAELLLFLSDAQNYFNIVIVTARSVEDVCKALAAADLSESLNPEYKKDQSFLLKKIQSWDEWEGRFADVLISDDHDREQMLNDYKFSIGPNLGPFWRFWESYDEPPLFHPRAWAALRASVEMAQNRIDHALTNIYDDPESIWRKVLATEEAKTLLELFSRARQILHLPHPQDKVKDDLKFYFQYAAVGKKIPDVRLVRELIGVREGLSRQFLRENIGGFYPGKGESERILLPQHQKAIDAALIAIHNVIRREPRL